MLAEKVMYICDVMNRHDYTPKLPDHNDLDLVYDTSITDVQPYLFKVGFGGLISVAFTMVIVDDSITVSLINYTRRRVCAHCRSLTLRRVAGRRRAESAHSRS